MTHLSRRQRSSGSPSSCGGERSRTRRRDARSTTRMAISRVICRHCPTGTGKHPVEHPWRRRCDAHHAPKPLHQVHLADALNHYRPEVEDTVDRWASLDSAGVAGSNCRRGRERRKTWATKTFLVSVACHIDKCGKNEKHVI